MEEICIEYIIEKHYDVGNWPGYRLYKSLSQRVNDIFRLYFTSVSPFVIDFAYFWQLLIHYIKIVRETV